MSIEGMITFMFTFHGHKDGNSNKHISHSVEILEISEYGIGKEDHGGLQGKLERKNS